MPPALPGMLSGFGSCTILPHINSVAAFDTVTITPPATVDNSKEYKVIVNGRTVSFTTDANATTAELGAGLYAAIQQDPVVYGLVDVALNTGTSVITLTARTVDLPLTVATNSADTTNDIAIAKTVSTSSNAIIPFGRFVGRKSTYTRDTLEGVSQATLIDATSGYEVLGVTLSSQATQKVGRFSAAKDGYAFDTVMNVLKNIGTYKGVWVESVDADLAIGDTPYIAVASGNEGKITKTSSGNLAAGSNIKIISAAQQSFGKNIALIEIKL
ncbi:hypothetical protein VF04_04520 [Nostoc linckia z7]|nr:hypothetical protein VF04_04520 [Nostoc linckia z7]PHK48130.1 hypothetical protein VF13_02195 [Nostoc linckia z16]